MQLDFLLIGICMLRSDIVISYALPTHASKLKTQTMAPGPALAAIYIRSRPCMVFRHPSINSIRSGLTNRVQRPRLSSALIPMYLALVSYLLPTDDSLSVMSSLLPTVNSLSVVSSLKSTSNPRPSSCLVPSLEPSLSSKSGALLPTSG